MASRSGERVGPMWRRSEHFDSLRKWGGSSTRGVPEPLDRRAHWAAERSRCPNPSESRLSKPNRRVGRNRGRWLYNARNPDLGAALAMQKVVGSNPISRFFPANQRLPSRLRIFGWGVIRPRPGHSTPEPHAPSSPFFGTGAQKRAIERIGVDVEGAFASRAVGQGFDFLVASRRVGPPWSSLVIRDSVAGHDSLFGCVGATVERQAKRRLRELRSPRVNDRPRGTTRAG
jgi:hypothetical protein